MSFVGLTDVDTGQLWVRRDALSSTATVFGLFCLASSWGKVPSSRVYRDRFNSFARQVWDGCSTTAFLPIERLQLIALLQIGTAVLVQRLLEAIIIGEEEGSNKSHFSRVYESRQRWPVLHREKGHGGFTKSTTLVAPNLGANQEKQSG